MNRKNESGPAKGADNSGHGFWISFTIELRYKSSKDTKNWMDSWVRKKDQTIDPVEKLTKVQERA